MNPLKFRELYWEACGISAIAKAIMFTRFVSAVGPCAVFVPSLTKILQDVAKSGKCLVPVAVWSPTIRMKQIHYTKWAYGYSTVPEISTLESFPAFINPRCYNVIQSKMATIFFISNFLFISIKQKHIMEPLYYFYLCFTKSKYKHNLNFFDIFFY